MVLVASGGPNFLQNKNILFSYINIFQLDSCGLRWAKSSSVFFNSLHLFLKKEKSLFGFAALLMNNTPGVIFDAWDLVSSAIAFCLKISSTISF